VTLVVNICEENLWLFRVRLGDYKRGRVYKIFLFWPGIILATLEAKINRVSVGSQPRQKVSEIPS
jgi:hypothetical protein